MDADSPPSDFPPPVPVERAKPTLAERAAALIEVLICSDYPTQLALGGAFHALGFLSHNPDGTLNINYVAALSLVDTVLLVGLMLMFLASHQERPRDVFLGPKPVAHEIRIGVMLVFVALGIAIAVLLILGTVAPWLHTVERNPLQELLRTRRNAVIFAIVVLIAGGVREELQRAFILHRFERSLGGSTFGVIVASAAFGAGHLLQGADAAVATALLGAFWAVVYLRRRSVVAPIVSHAGFDLLQVAQFLTLGR